MENCQMISGSKGAPELQRSTKSFTRMELIDILRELEDDYASGILMFMREGERKGLFMFEGKIIHAHSNRPGEKFKDFLLSCTAIDAAKLETISHQKSKNTHLGVLLLEKEIIYPLAMRDVLRRMITEIASSIFEWEQGEYYFSPEIYNPVIEEHAVVPIGAVIVEGVKKLGKRQPWLKTVSPSKGWMRPIPTRSLLDLCFQLSDEEEIFLNRIKKEAAVEAFFKSTRQDEEKAQLLLAGLIMAGYMNVQDEGENLKGEGRYTESNPMPDNPSSAKAKLNKASNPGQSINAGFNGTGELTYEEVLSAFKVNCHQVHRHIPGTEKPIWERKVKSGKSREPKGSPTQRVPGDTKNYRVPPVIAQRKMKKKTELAEATFVPLKHAASHNVQLDSAVNKCETTQTRLRQDKKKQMAEDLYRKAEEQYREGKFFDVVKLLEDAIHLVPETGKFHNLLGLTQTKNDHITWQKRAEVSFRTAIDSDPWQPEFFVNLANLYQKRGLTSRAIKNYKLALMLDPKSEDAIKQLDKLIVGL